MKHNTMEHEAKNIKHLQTWLIEGQAAIKK